MAGRYLLTGLLQPKAEVPTVQRPSGLAVSAGRGAANAPREAMRAGRRMMSFMMDMREGDDESVEWLR
jgi:hypothetical protein